MCPSAGVKGLLEVDIVGVDRDTRVALNKAETSSGKFIMTRYMKYPEFSSAIFSEKLGKGLMTQF